jgi:hypothetical protein
MPQCLMAPHVKTAMSVELKAMPVDPVYAKDTA